MLTAAPVIRPLAPGLFFIADERDDGTRMVDISANGISNDSARVTDEVADFLLTDLRRWILLGPAEAEEWFGGALRRARAVRQQLAAE